MISISDLDKPQETQCNSLIPPPAPKPFREATLPYDDTRGRILHIPISSNGNGHSSRKDMVLNVPGEIVFEAQNAFYDSLRRGNPDAGFQALEEGLEKLSTPGAYQDSLALLCGKIRILSDLERYDDARALLSRLTTGGRSCDILDEVAVADSDNPDKRFEENLIHAEDALDLSVKAKDWREAGIAAAEILKQDASHFTVESPMDRFKNCKKFLNLGSVQENLALNGDPAMATRRMEEALRKYSQGCSLTEVYRKHIDPPIARLTSFDHAVCANLFFSAARISIYLSKNLHHVVPKAFDCEPRLTAQDWKHQALEFLERGKSRALLESIIRNEIIIPPKQRELLEEIASAATYLIAARKRDSFNGNQTPVSGLRNSNSGETFIMNDDIWRRIRARMNWRRLILGALNPTLNSALPTRNHAELTVEMWAEIPQDTAFIEYGLASEASQGLVMLVITSQGVEEASWQPVSCLKVRQQIAALRELMDIRDDRTKNLPTEYRLGEADEIIQYLSEILVRPFESHVASKAKLVFIPSGDLAHVPWTMLMMRRTLGTIPAVTVVPSLSIWHRLHCPINNPSHPVISTPNISIISDSPRNEKGELRNIPFSRIEALHIARIHDKWPILADQNDRSAFEFQAKSAQILHLSAHGNFNHESPMLSSIHLFSGSLTVLDLSKLIIKSQLVVFSSCMSGFSRVFDSGSAFSFAHTLLGTGTHAFIGTLWRVDDAATLLVMMIFYEELQKGVSPAEALRTAQISIRSMSQHLLNRLVGKLTELMLNPGARKKVGDFVINPKFWIDRLRNQKLDKLQEARCWAAFVLTGYGYRPIYRSNNV
ncbi:hypothetical protein AOQ84DRAFT_385340 [Glonium stellatum]|uniref:CHAT domain-containing protein n=1 Tax=Glonium stellatum TaxID=574774 RepID=A0A8E2FBQ4_9PEZI|nr:hypothetical protein AOQ84DRAFT_385340 [Glonium stellatum]